MWLWRVGWQCMRVCVWGWGVGGLKCMKQNSNNKHQGFSSLRYTHYQACILLFCLAHLCYLSESHINSNISQRFGSKANEVVSLLSQHHHLLNPDVLASPVTGGFICQQHTGETYSSCLFSPLSDVSTLSGMHSSCPSFAHVTNVCLAVCKIRSSSFFFPIGGSFFPPRLFFFLYEGRNLSTLQQTQERRQTKALCFFMWFN